MATNAMPSSATKCASCFLATKDRESTEIVERHDHSDGAACGGPVEWFPFLRALRVLCGHTLRVLRGAAPRAAAAALAVLVFVATAGAQELPPPPALTQPVNDFAGVIDAASQAEMERLIRALQQASGDVVVVATVETVQPYPTINHYAVEMFENQGRGIGAKDEDNGLLILLAVNDRKVWVEVGYGLEQFITDGFAGETSREYMAPSFRRGEYGRGLLAGAARIIERIAERRNVTLEGVRPERAPPEYEDEGEGGGALVFLIVMFVLLNAIAARTRRRRRRGWWGMAPWIGGWHSGVGPFGGGFGGGRRGGFGGFGGGGFGCGFGGFGGFGGGGSGGGGGGASW
jgi:uncharacterized protein